MPVTPRTPTIISEDTPFSEYSENGLRGYLNQHENDITDLQADYTDKTAHVNATEAHGATGAVVGTTNTQTLTNKTINAPDNTVTNIKGVNLSNSTDFGASSKKLLNFVPRDQSSLSSWDAVLTASGAWANRSVQSIVGTSAVRVRMYWEWYCGDSRGVLMVTKGGTHSGTTPQNTSYTIQSLKAQVSSTTDAPTTGILEVDLDASQQIQTMVNVYGNATYGSRGVVIGWYEPASTA